MGTRIVDVKVIRRNGGRTRLQAWETYWFSVRGVGETWGIEKVDGVFHFFSKHCGNLKEAKQHIVDELAKGVPILAL